MVAYLQKSAPGDDAADASSPREREVLQLLAGQADQEISALLCVSERTVEAHRKNIMTRNQPAF